MGVVVEEFVALEWGVDGLVAFAVFVDVRFVSFQGDCLGVR